MSYATIAELAQDATFQGRVKSCATIECQQNLGRLGSQTTLAFPWIRPRSLMLASPRP